MKCKILIILLSIIHLNGCSTSKHDATSEPTGEGWLFELVADGEGVGLHNSLTITSDSRVHVAFYNEVERKLHYAERTTGGHWNITKLDSIGWKGRDVTIQAGSGDTLHMVYQDIWLKDLRYARYAGNIWEYESIDPPNSWGRSTVMLIEGPDIHIAEIFGGTRIHYWIGSLHNWIKIKNPISVKDPFQIDLALGSTGPAFAISYQEVIGTWMAQTTEYGVAQVKANDTSDYNWDYQVINEGYLEPTYTAIEYDGEGVLHLLYIDNESILRDITGLVVDNSVLKETVRIELSSDGTLWVLYAKSESLALSQYTPGGTWQKVSAIQNINPDGKWDLHLSSDGRLHVSFYEESRHQLWYARWDG